MHLVSQEGESFDIKASVAKMSNLVKTMITDGERTKRLLQFDHFLFLYSRDDTLHMKLFVNGSYIVR